MRINIESEHLNGVKIITHPDVAEDERGFFLEAFRADVFAEAGLPSLFRHDNHSRSRSGVLRGLHFQWDPPLGKLMRVTQGSAFLVAVDIRKGSPTLGQWYGTEVSAQNKKQVWAPAGFARGFYVLSDYAELQYKCTAIYNPKGESGIRWDDPRVGVKWPFTDPSSLIISPKDSDARSLDNWLASPESDTFRY